MSNPPYILIDYCMSYDGPTLRFMIEERGLLEKLKELMEILAAEKLGRVNITDALPVVMNHFQTIEMVLLVGRDTYQKSLFIPRKHSSDTKVQWIQSATGWSQSSGLIEGLLQADNPGHQYLTDGGFDDAIIEVSFQGG